MNYNNRIPNNLVVFNTNRNPFINRSIGNFRNPFLQPINPVNIPFPRNLVNNKIPPLQKFSIPGNFDQKPIPISIPKQFPIGYSRPQPTNKIKKDPTLDSEEEMRKWIEARKRNYPSSRNIKKREERVKENEELGGIEEPESSKLEKKLRRKLHLISSFDNPRRQRKLEQRERELKKAMNKSQKLSNTMDFKGKSKKKVKTSTTKEEFSKLHPNEENLSVIIENLISKREKEEESLSSFIEKGRIQAANYKYKDNHLLSNLMLEEMNKERSSLLQMIRYIVKSDFFSEVSN